MAYDPAVTANRIVIKGEWDTIEQLERTVADALGAAYRAGAHAGKKHRTRAEPGPSRADLGGPPYGDFVLIR